MHNLRTQLSMTMMLLIFLTVAVLGLSSNLVINQAFAQYITKQQQVKADDIISTLSSQYNGLTQEWNVEYIHGTGMYALLDGYVIKVYDRSGESVWDAENHNMAMCMTIMEEISERMEERRPDISGEFVSYDYDLKLSEQKIGSVTIKYYGPYFLSESDFYFLDTLNYIWVITGVISLILAFITSAILARRIARPIATTADIAKRIANGNYSTRFEGNTKTKELAELVTAVNCLADSLDKQENLRKRLTVDVAHELRTPLTTLSSHLEAMIEGVWAPTTKRLQSCYEEISRLSGLVADLERLAKTESDNLILNKTNVDLMEIALSCRNHFEIEIKKKNLTLTITGGSSFVDADKDRLDQVMRNLISNAIKYTAEHGTINITVEDDKNRSILSVEDDGIGIPEHELPLIFERFYRTDKSRNRKTGGAGIGLTIVKSIVTAHGGTIEAKSCAERGSCFIITLPK